MCGTGDGGRRHRATGRDARRRAQRARDQPARDRVDRPPRRAPPEPHPPPPPQRAGRPRDAHGAEAHAARRGLPRLRRGRPGGRPAGGRRHQRRARRGVRGHQRRRGVLDPDRARNIGRGVGALGWPQLVAQNDATSYDTEIGALGTALDRAGIGRFVVGNADQTSETGPVLHREVALGLVDGTGRVPGQVTDLLRRAPTAPFGRELDLDAVDRAFPADFGTRRQVVLVEASDLARADAYRPMAAPEQRAVLHAEALQRSDELVGRLLAARRPAPRRGDDRLAVPHRRGPAPSPPSRSTRRTAAPACSSRRRHGAPASSRSSTSRRRSSTCSTSSRRT